MNTRPRNPQSDRHLLPRLLTCAAVVLALVSACAGEPEAEPEVATAAAVLPEALRGEPDWLFPADDCPADVIPEQEERISYLGDRCAGDELDDCLRKCRDDDDGDACYAAALAVQALDLATHAEALFLRSCRQGIASGCTNRAAGLVAVRGEGDAEAADCAARTYFATCAWRDPWGCAMYGRALVHGIGVEVDIERARRVLTAGCRFGDDDGACTFSKELLAALPPEAEAEIGGV